MSTPGRTGRTRAFRDVLPFALGLAAIIGVLLATTFVYTLLTDGLRAYVNAESLWTKAQKRAVFALDEYASQGGSEELRAYREALRIPLAYRRARELLLAPELDREAARRAILEGGTHPDDVAETILVVRWFRELPAVHEAVSVWATGDAAVDELRELGDSIVAVVEARGADAPEAVALADRLGPLDRRLTALEQRFSVIMGELDRRLTRSFLAVLMALGVLLFVLGTGLAWTLLARIRASEAAVLDREERLRLVARATSDIVWDLDPATGETEWSEALAKRFGYDPDRISGDLAWWTERVHPDDREAVTTRLVDALEGDRELYTAEYRFRKADGRYAEVYDRGYVRRDDGGEPVRVIGSMFDLTANREIERALRRSEVRYRELLEQASDAILILTDDLKVEMVNGEACSLLGYERHELLGLDVRELIAPESPAAEPLRVDEVREGGTLVVEREVARKDGSTLPMEFSTRQLEDGRIQTIGRDIRQRRDLEARLRQSQKMEAVGRLAGGIAHDFNNLLTAIRGHLQLILSDLRDGARLREDVEAADAAAERAGSLVSQLLTFSRRQPVEAQVLELNGRLRQMHDMLGRLAGERVDVALELEPGAGRVRMDPVQVEQVVLNLLLNARDAMPRGGTVRISTARVDGGGAWPSEAPDGGYLRLRVRDEGVGMSPETRERIFEPFYTEKDAGQGTGLGLATVYGIVEEADGEIRVESEPGEGSTFDVFLPRVEETATDDG